MFLLIDEISSQGILLRIVAVANSLKENTELYMFTLQKEVFHKLMQF